MKKKYISPSITAIELREPLMGVAVSDNNVTVNEYTEGGTEEVSADGW